MLVFFQEIDWWLDLLYSLTVEVPAPGPDEYRPVGEDLSGGRSGRRRRETASPRCMARRLVERVVAVYVEATLDSRRRIFVDPYQACVTGGAQLRSWQWVPRLFHGCRLFAAFSTLGRCERRDAAASSAWLLILSLITGVIVTVTY